MITSLLLPIILIHILTLGSLILTTFYYTNGPEFVASIYGYIFETTYGTRLLPIIQHNLEYAAKYTEMIQILYIHTSIVVAMALGLILLNRNIRNRSFFVHKWVGRLYMILMTVGALFGNALSFYEIGGRTSIAAFAYMSFLVIVPAYIGYYYIRFRKDMNKHREWMIRAYFTLWASGLGFRLIIWLVMWPIKDPELWLYFHYINVFFSPTLGLIISEFYVRTTRSKQLDKTTRLSQKIE